MAATFERYRIALMAQYCAFPCERLQLVHEAGQHPVEPCACPLCALPDDAEEREFREIFEELHEELHVPTHWSRLPFKEDRHWHSATALGQRSTFKRGRHAGENDAIAEECLDIPTVANSVDFSQRLQASIAAARHSVVPCQSRQTTATKKAKGSKAQTSAAKAEVDKKLADKKDKTSRGTVSLQAVFSETKLLKQLQAHAQTNPTLALELAEKFLVRRLERLSAQEVATPRAAACLAASLRDYWQHFGKMRDELAAEFTVALAAYRKAMEEQVRQDGGLPVHVQELLLILEHGGEMLLKGNRPTPHELATSFVPDHWQADVLESIKQDRSVVVSAPTTAGKSFASLFVVEQVYNATLGDEMPGSSLRASKRATKANAKKKEKAEKEAKKKAKKKAQELKKSGIYPSQVVFVAPEAPLVNQQAADLRREFGSMKKADGSAVQIGYCTATSRRHEDTCDVLVCTPAMLEILLLSPVQQQWRRNLKWVIFDEIQEVASEQEGAEALRRVISMVECSILALSATLSNPTALREYLEKIRGSAVHMVPEYSPDEPNLQRWVTLEYGRVTKRGHGHEIVHLHPYGLLSSCTGARFDTLLENLAHVELSPRQLAAAIRWCADSWPEHLDDIVELLHGSVGETAELDQLMAITVADLAVIRHRLVGFLLKLQVQPRDFLPLADNNGEGTLCIEGQNAADKEDEEEDDDDDEEEEEERKEETEETEEERVGMEEALAAAKEQRWKTASEVVRKTAETLQETGHLPALFFSDDTELIEEVYERMVAYLEANSDASQVPTMDARLWGDEDEDDATEQARPGRYNEPDTFFASIREDVWPVDPNFSFRCTATQDAGDVRFLKWWLAKLRREVSTKRLKWMVAGLARGVACHHRGLSLPYRNLVEYLIRAGVVTVCFTSRTLALGINLQIKTVVLLDGDKFLQPGSFAQQCGRAGRRFVDEQGLVLPLALGDERLARLVVQPPADLCITAQVTVFDVLRLSILANSTDDACVREYVDRVRERWTTPVGDDEASQEDLRLQFLFSQELLLRLHLLDSSFRPCGLAGMVYHCHEAGLRIVALASLLLARQTEDMSYHAAACLASFFLAPRPFQARAEALTRWLNYAEDYRAESALCKDHWAVLSAVVRATAQDVAPAGALLGRWGPWPLHNNQWLYHFLTHDCNNGNAAFIYVLNATHSTDSNLYASIRGADLLLRKVATSLGLCMGTGHPVAKVFQRLSQACTKRFKEVQGA